MVLIDLIFFEGFAWSEMRFWIRRIQIYELVCGLLFFLFFIFCVINLQYPWFGLKDNFNFFILRIAELNIFIVLLYFSGSLISILCMFGLLVVLASTTPEMKICLFFLGCS